MVVPKRLCKHCNCDATPFTTHKGWWKCDNEEGPHVFPMTDEEKSETINVEPVESNFEPTPPKARIRKKKK